MTAEQSHGVLPGRGRVGERCDFSKPANFTVCQGLCAFSLPALKAHAIGLFPLIPECLCLKYTLCCTAT